MNSNINNTYNFYTHNEIIRNLIDTVNKKYNLK